MYQTPTWKVAAFCHTRSGFPSPLKSFVPTTVQPTSPCCDSQSHQQKIFPFEPPLYQTTTWNVELFCHTRSGLPSLLKSPVAVRRQPAADDEDCASQSHQRKLFPFVPPMYHTPTWKVASFCHTRSGLPSPFKSAAPTRRQPATEE